jgi:hypothetical protein
LSVEPNLAKIFSLFTDLNEKSQNFTTSSKSQTVSGMSRVCLFWGGGGREREGDGRRERGKKSTRYYNVV